MQLIIKQQQQQKKNSIQKNKQSQVTYFKVD